MCTHTHRTMIKTVNDCKGSCELNCAYSNMARLLLSCLASFMDILEKCNNQRCNNQNRKRKKKKRHLPFDDFRWWQSPVMLTKYWQFPFQPCSICTLTQTDLLLLAINMLKVLNTNILKYQKAVTQLCRLPYQQQIHSLPSRLSH